VSGTAPDTGAPEPITSRRVLRIAGPIVLSNATVPILGAVDTGVVGQLGLAAPIGAVGIGAIILTFLYWMFGFLRMGTSGLTGQAIGERDSDEVAALLVRGLMIGAVAGLAFIILQIPLFWLGFQLSPASAEVEGLAQKYMEIRIWGAPAAIAAYAMTGWLIAAERTREVLVLQLVINGVNIALDLWFVLGLGWGVEGVAIATLIAEWIGLALGLWMCREVFAGTVWRDRALILAPERLKRMAAVNGDIMVRSILLEIGFAAFLFKAADFDDVTLAANQILMQFMHITAHALDGFAFSAEALVGRAVGARARSTLRRAAILTSQWGFVCVAALSMAFLFGGGEIIRWMTTAEDVRNVAYDYLFWMALAPLVGLPAWMLDGIFIGATRTRDMRNAMLISVPIYLAAMFVLSALWGNHGLWLAMLLFFGLRGLTLAVRYPGLEAAADAPVRSGGAKR
jgi:MATE family multidrug resistance protein